MAIKLLLGVFERLNADSQLKVADFAFEDPASIRKVRQGRAKLGACSCQPTAGLPSAHRCHAPASTVSPPRI